MKAWCLLSVGICVALCSATARAVMIYAPTTVTASSEYNGTYAVTKMSDETVTEADINVTSYGGVGQYAGSGLGPHNVFMDFGSSITADAFGYSQRLGANPALDKVTQIEFWFEGSDPAGVLPVRSADATVAITDTTDQVFTSYDLGDTFSSQFVALRLTGNAGNPGGSEFRMLQTTVPEPSTLVLAGLGLSTLLIAGWRRRRRRIGQ